MTLYHEHTRPDRSGYIIFHPECCVPFCPDFPINLGYYPSPDYDIDSIMQYPSWAFSNGVCPTITDLDNKVLPKAGTSLSPMDISHIRKLYKCPGVSPPKCNKACSTAPGKCHPTAPSCISPAPGAANPRLACSCRAGFKATKAGIADGDVSKQWRLQAPEGNFRVWVAEGVECNTPCRAFSCQEVTELPAECLHN